MAGIRFVVVTLIAFFLLSPLIKSRSTQIEKPIIVIAQDNSESVKMGWQNKKEDSANYVRAMNELTASLENKFSVKKISFGEKIKDGIDFSFNEKTTDISAALNYIDNSFSNQNLGAIILTSDGLYNQGSNPIYAEKKWTVPVFSIALGDTSERKDLVLSKVNYNRIVYLGDKFGLKVDVSAKNCKGEQTILSVINVGAQHVVPLQKKNISIKENSFDSSAIVILDADKVGIQHYRISLSSVKDEITAANNSRDIFIEVLDSRQKILLLANSPHPDISALKQAIETKKNYEVNLQYADKIANTFSVKEYNLIIFHQLPSKTQTVKNIYEKIVKENIPVLFIIGSQTNIPQFNTAQSVLQILGRTTNTNEVQAVPQKNFTFFTLTELLTLTLKNFPPLFVPFGEYKVVPNAQILLTQKIGMVETQNPLLLFSQSTGNKIGILCGEGFWKWRLHDFMLNKNHDATDELISRTVQFLAVKADKSQFRIILPKNNFDENEAITMDAELYDESYQLSNIPDVELKIVDEEGKEFPFVFSKNEKAYFLNAGYFPIGNYRYFAKTKFNNKDLTAKGQFSISPLQLEMLQTTANHSLLFQLGENSGGEVFYPGNINRIAEKISKNASIKPISYSTFKTNSLINLKWLFFLLLTGLSVEWFVRKWNGAY